MQNVPFCKANPPSSSRLTTSFHSHLLMSFPFIVKWDSELERGLAAASAMHSSLTLTSSAQLCGLPRHCIPPATCPPGEWASGRSAWTPVCPCTSASPGTGTAAPSGIRPGAGERKRALFTALNSRGRPPPAGSSLRSRALPKGRLACK